MAILEKSTGSQGLRDEEAQGLGRMMVAGGVEVPTIVRDPGLVRCFEALDDAEGRTRTIILAHTNRQ